MLYCYCQSEEFGEMIACDSISMCSIEWFHFNCLHLAKISKENGTALIVKS